MFDTIDEPTLMPQSRESIASTRFLSYDAHLVGPDERIKTCIPHCGLSRLVSLPCKTSALVHLPHSELFPF